MSVRANGAGDHLALTGAFGIGTGDFSVGMWCKVVNVRGSTYVEFLSLATDEVDAPTVYLAFGTDNSTTPVAALFDTATGAGTPSFGQAMSAGVWRWLVITRSGTTVTASVFDDTTSTTPTYTMTSGSAGAGDLASLDWLIVGMAFTSDWPDAEFANLKLHQGVAWSNAQARAESQHTDAQTGGGAWKVRCTLADTTTGLTNAGTLGGSLTNTGCVNGASNPSQLTFDSGDTGTESSFRRLVAVKGTA